MTQDQFDKWCQGHGHEKGSFGYTDRLESWLVHHRDEEDDPSTIRAMLRSLEPTCKLVLTVEYDYTQDGKGTYVSEPRTATWWLDQWNEANPWGSNPKATTSDAGLIELATNPHAYFTRYS